jgi:hypothetical protein
MDVSGMTPDTQLHAAPQYRTGPIALEMPVRHTKVANAF